MSTTLKKQPSEYSYLCRICKNHVLKPWINLGLQPLANNLLVKLAVVEPMYNLSVVYCPDCGLVQLDRVVPPTELFTNYLYYSSTSPVFRDHFKELAEKEMNLDRVKTGQMIVDIGSNDGILLHPFRDKGVKVLGIEPCGEIANTAAKSGIETIPEYFTPELAHRIVDNYGKPTLVTMTNVFAHVDDLHSLLDGVKTLIGTWGRFMIEVPYLPDMIKQGTFDLVYHEHLSYFTLSTLIRIFEDHDLSILEAEFVPVHGGSIRVYVSSFEAVIFQSVNTEFMRRIVKREKDFTSSREFLSFPSLIEKNKTDTLNALFRLKKKNKRIVGYGAPAKLSTLTNYYQIPDGTFDFVIDDASEKQGKYTPGKHVKIVALPEFPQRMADYVFIFAWNFANPIKQMLKSKGYKGKFIIPFPKVTIL